MILQLDEFMIKCETPVADNNAAFLTANEGRFVMAKIKTISKKEIWKDIPGDEGRYQASTRGRIRSVDREVRCVSKAGLEFLRPIRGKILAPCFCREYLIVNLAPQGTIAVHLLVAITFLQARKKGYEANHKDGVKTNNHYRNLEWVTKSGNQTHAVYFGLRKQCRSVIGYSKTRGKRLYPSMGEAEYQLTGRRGNSHICRAVKTGQLAYGYRWKAA